MASFTATVPLNLVWRPSAGAAPVTIVAAAGSAFVIADDLADQFEAEMGPTVNDVASQWPTFRSDPVDQDLWDALQRGEELPKTLAASRVHDHVVVSVAQTTNPGRIRGLTRL